MSRKTKDTILLDKLALRLDTHGMPDISTAWGSNRVVVNDEHESGIEASGADLREALANFFAALENE